jgi:hypothetical protein
MPQRKSERLMASAWLRAATNLIPRSHVQELSRADGRLCSPSQASFAAIRPPPLEAREAPPPAPSCTSGRCRDRTSDLLLVRRIPQSNRNRWTRAERARKPSNCAAFGLRGYPVDHARFRPQTPLAGSLRGPERGRCEGRRRSLSTAEDERRLPALSPFVPALLQAPVDVPLVAI